MAHLAVRCVATSHLRTMFARCAAASAITNCEILDCVTEGDRAFAKMRFSGLHTGIFRGYQPTGKPVYWLSAALFRIEREVITELWVLGDLASLDHVLRNNQVA